jgi:hypothetical protein
MRAVLARIKRLLGLTNLNTAGFPSPIALRITAAAIRTQPMITHDFDEFAIRTSSNFYRTFLLEKKFDSEPR